MATVTAPKTSARVPILLRRRLMKKAEDYHDGNHGIEHPVDFNVKQHGKDVVHNIHSKKKFRRQGERNFNTNEYFLTQALP